MKFSSSPLAAACMAALSAAAFAQQETASPVKHLGIVTVHGGRPTSLPTQIPSTMEGSTKEQIAATVNAADSEDAIKYFPSLLVRKRYIGDYNHAVLSSRASGTGNSARSAVYADGILLSNYLGNGAAYAPRWGMVAPEEIERVDVMYGPFSAAYPGNSVGAIVDYVTRMPNKFEAHAKVSVFSQPYDLYGTHDTFNGKQVSAALGNRSGAWSWWLNFNHTDSHGQPQTFVTSATPGPAGASGAVAALNRSNNPWFILGSGSEYQTLQDHAKIKLAYDLSPTLRASYTLGYWQNTSQGRPQTYLRDAAGNPVYVAGFTASDEQLAHVMHGLSLKSNTRGVWDWELAASRYDFAKDQLRAPSTAFPAAIDAGAGIITDQAGTGWHTFALKGTWRPQGMQGAHIVDLGYQLEQYSLRILRSNTGDWINGSPAALATDVGGKTRLQSLYGQDAWAFAPNWKTVLGLRLEQWQAFNGYTRVGMTASPAYSRRSETHLSPKAALAFQLAADTTLKAAIGRAVRMPTVAELYGTTAGNVAVVNDPNLKPEKSWTSELSLEKDLGSALLRATLFYEVVRDSLYSERIALPDNTTVVCIANVGKIRTPGFELALRGSDIFRRGLDLSGSLTYANSRIVENAGYVTVPGDTLGQYQPRVPVWRATALATYRFTPQWQASLGMRYSGKQYATLDNSDINGFAYQGASRFFTTDFRLRYVLDKQWTAAFGIDNLNNYKYWNFHPYPQRTYSAELKFAM